MKRCFGLIVFVFFSLGLILSCGSDDSSGGSQSNPVLVGGGGGNGSESFSVQAIETYIGEFQTECFSEGEDSGVSENLTLIINQSQIRMIDTYYSYTGTVSCNEENKIIRSESRLNWNITGEFKGGAIFNMKMLSEIATTFTNEGAELFMEEDAEDRLNFSDWAAGITHELNYGDNGDELTVVAKRMANLLFVSLLYDPEEGENNPDPSDETNPSNLKFGKMD